MNNNEELAKKALKNLAVFMTIKWTAIILINKTAKRMVEKP